MTKLRGQMGATQRAIERIRAQRGRTMYTMAAVAECGGHYYVFRYDEAHVPEVLRAIQSVADDPRFGFDRDDGYALCTRVLDVLEDELGL